MSKNTRFMEIEQKYGADKIDRKEFVSKVTALAPKNQLRVKGPDTYYTMGREIVRWRYGTKKSELTIKNRMSSKNTFVRQEVDLDIAKNHPKTVLKFLKSAGAVKLFRIHKDCHIFWFTHRRGSVSVVIYDVKSKNSPDRRFIEIEAEKGQGYEDSKRLVRIWERRLGLKPNQRISKSLYEIYSGNTTPESST